MATLRKKIKTYRLDALITTFFLAVPVVLFVLIPAEKSTDVFSKCQRVLLVIDAGHGGIDSGAIAADGSKESDINLNIALKLRAIAEFIGQDNLMIRQEDVTMSDGHTYSEHRDLERRAEIVNTAGECIYFSIHQNFYPTGQPRGSLVIYASGSESEQLGKLTHENLTKCLNPDNRRIAEPANDRFYVLSHVSCPAILVECGFMSNFSEMEKLKSDKYQNSLAAVLMASFLQYKQSSMYI